MFRDKALLGNTKDWVQDNVRFAVDGAPPPYRIPLIAKPEYVPAAEANFMRDDDLSLIHISEPKRRSGIEVCGM